MKNLNQNVSRFDQDVLTIDQQIEENSRLRTQIEKSIIERDTQLQKSMERVGGATDELSQFDSKMQLQREKADQLGRDQIDLINQLGETRNILSSLKTNLE